MVLKGKSERHLKNRNAKFSISVLQLRAYERFSDAPTHDVAIVMGRLGLHGGAMRQRALRHDPHCVIACLPNPLGRWPVAWLTLTKAGAWGCRYRVVQVFVEPRWRRRGIGKRLVRLMMQRWGTRNLGVIDDGRGVRKFYKEAGLS
jgi:GNAT superfamily N-acetyltransferase